jgi:hypothetical protein
LLRQSLGLLIASRSPIFRSSVAFLVGKPVNILMFKSLGFI